MLSPEQLRLLHPRKRLAAFLPPTPKELAGGGAEEEAGPQARRTGSKVRHRHCYPAACWRLTAA